MDGAIDIHYWVSHYGGLALVLISFIAATIVPLSSEAALVAGIASGIPTTEAVIACSIGNCAACVANYALGWFIRSTFQSRLAASRSGARAMAWTERYGAWSLLLSWLPIIGDPLTIAAGVVRIHPVLFCAVVWTLRIARYLVLVLVV